MEIDRLYPRFRLRLGLGSLAMFIYLVCPSITSFVFHLLTGMVFFGVCVCVCVCVCPSIPSRARHGGLIR
jgi:hypothetical protein